MNNKKYIMIGMPILTKNIFRNILRPLNNYSFKPTGGLWASEYISNIYTISEWHSYLLEARSIALYKDINQASLFTLKENAKILEIKTFKELQEIIQKYPSYHHSLNYYQTITDNNNTFDFEELSKDYDGIYINPNNIEFYKSRIFDNWSVKTLLLFNLDCIKEYQSVTIEVNLDYYDCIPHITDITDTKPIVEKSNTYIELYQLAKTIFLDLLRKNNNIVYKDYDNYLEIIIETANKTIEIINKNALSNQLAEIYIEQKLKIDKMTIIRNIVLNIISEYFDKEKEIIKNLSKSNNTKIKTYKI